MVEKNRMDAAIRKAKDSIGQIFDKNLHDLVRGIRNHKENEVRLSHHVPVSWS